MPWIRKSGIKGLVFVPEQYNAGDKKHECPDCFHCQMCCDIRCDECQNSVKGEEVGKCHIPLPAKLFLAIMFTEKKACDHALKQFMKEYGALENQFGPLNVSQFTNYYNKEMGEGINKIYITFKDTIKRDILPELKIFTNTIESKFLNQRKRTVNMDPGYITNDKFVLATTKDFYHRIYLKNGIYAEVTLHYRTGKYRYFSWTYPDYKETGVQNLLEQSRALLISKLRKSQ